MRGEDRREETEGKKRANDVQIAGSRRRARFKCEEKRQAASEKGTSKGRGERKPNRQGRGEKKGNGGGSRKRQEKVEKKSEKKNKLEVRRSKKKKNFID